MGCGSSSADAFAETIATAAVMDLALAPGLTDADAATVACDAQPHRPLALRMPRWGRPGAALSGDGLAQLCLAGAGSLRSVELNEAAVPRVTPEAAAQALGLLGDVREVSLRGESLPRRVLAVLGSAGAMPMTTVRSVLLGGRGVDAVALAALPRAFPCVERLYLQGPTGVVEWRSTVAGLVQRGVVLSHVTHVVFDTAEPLDADTERALRPLWPRLEGQALCPPPHRVQPAMKSCALRSPRCLDALHAAPVLSPAPLRGFGPVCPVDGSLIDFTVRRSSPFTPGASSCGTSPAHGRSLLGLPNSRSASSRRVRASPSDLVEQVVTRHTPHESSHLSASNPRLMCSGLSASRLTERHDPHTVPTSELTVAVPAMQGSARRRPLPF